MGRDIEVTDEASPLHKYGKQTTQSGSEKNNVIIEAERLYPYHHEDRERRPSGHGPRRVYSNFGFGIPAAA